MQKLAHILSLMRGHRKMIVQTLCVSAFLILFSLLPPYFTKILIDNVYHTKDANLLYVVLVSTALISFFSNLISSLNGYFTHNLSMRLSLKTGLGFYHHIGCLNFSFFDNRETGEIISRSRDALSSLGGVMGIIRTTFMSVGTLLVFPPILFYMNWKLALLSMAVLPFDAVISWFMSKYTAKKTREIAEINAEVSAKRIEFISGIKTIQALNMEDYMFSRIKNLTLSAARIRLNMYGWQGASGFLVNVLHVGGVLLYGWYGWTQILSGDMSLGSYLAFTAYVGYLSGPMKGLLDLQMDFRRVFVHIDRFLEVYHIVPAIKEDPELPEGPPLEGHIEFRNVSFSYGESQPVISDVTVEIERGKTTAIVGKSGNGKTTFVQLIPRFYDPQAGAITIDGYDIKQMRLSALREQIGLVQQDPFLFYGSVFENISVGNNRVETWQVEEAARLAHAHDFIQEFSEGYNTQVGERGAQLSQGQKQRIVIARAILRNTPILILDEATSALDMESETKILQALQEIRKEKTTLLISHRVSTIRHADHILVIEDQRVAEQGTHDELIQHGNVYSQLYG